MSEKILTPQQVREIREFAPYTKFGNDATRLCASHEALLGECEMWRITAGKAQEQIAALTRDLDEARGIVGEIVRHLPDWRKAVDSPTTVPRGFVWSQSANMKDAEEDLDAWLKEQKGEKGND